MMKNISLASALLAALFTTHAYTFDHFDPHAASPTWSTTSTAMSPASTDGRMHIVQPEGIYNGLWETLCNKEGSPTDNALFNKPALDILIVLERKIQQLSDTDSTADTWHETASTLVTEAMAHARIEDQKIAVLCFKKESFLPMLCITTEAEFHGYNRTTFLENICTQESFGILDFDSTQVLKVGMIKNLNKALSIIAEIGRQDPYNSVSVANKYTHNDTGSLFMGDNFPSNLNCWLTTCAMNGSFWRSSPWLYCTLTQPLTQRPSRDSLLALPQKPQGMFSWLKKLRRTKNNRIAPEPSSTHPVWGRTLPAGAGDMSLDSVSFAEDE
jgi:hypothetical protein